MHRLALATLLLTTAACNALRVPQPVASAARRDGLAAGRRVVSGFTALALAAAAEPALAEEAQVVFEPRGITPEDSVIFVIGCVPFVWAGIEFWRRIAVGESFGTGRDSVVINDTSGNRPRPLQRVLGQDAIIAARILFGLAFASGALVLFAAGDLILK